MSSVFIRNYMRGSLPASLNRGCINAMSSQLDREMQVIEYGGMNISMNIHVMFCYFIYMDSQKIYMQTCVYNSCPPVTT